MEKKLTNKQKLLKIGEQLLTAKEDVINNILHTYITHVDSVSTNGKIAQIVIADNRDKKIIFQFDKAKYWKYEPQLEMAHVVYQD